MLNRLERNKAVKDFERELAIMCSLRHPNIVTVYGAVYELITTFLLLLSSPFLSASLS